MKCVTVAGTNRLFLDIKSKAKVFFAPFTLHLTCDVSQNCRLPREYLVHVSNVKFAGCLFGRVGGSNPRSLFADYISLEMKKQH